MINITDLFPNLSNLTKPKSKTKSKTVETKKDNDSATAYTKHHFETTPSLFQGKKFKKYQNMTEVDLEKNIDMNQFTGGYDLNLTEGFQLPSQLQLSANGLTNQSNNIIQKNDYSSDKSTLDNLKNVYNDTLHKYQRLYSNISKSTSNYFDRVNQNNPYLNKTVMFTSDQIAYVTNQGVVKYISDNDVLKSLDVPQTPLLLDIAWDDSWTPGAQIPTTPTLILGTPMKAGQSVGNEGVNIYVNQLVDNPNPTYMGCFSDEDPTNKTMDFIGGSSTTRSYTYDKCEQEALKGGWKYFALQNVDVNSSTGSCLVSNNEQSVTKHGVGYRTNGSDVVWSSNTGEQPGNIATLTNTGSLSVINPSGTSIFSSPNDTAQPSNYLGCYGDAPNRAMNLVNGGSQQYNLQQCQEEAKKSGSTYFGLQDSMSGTNAQCALSNGSDLSSVIRYGKAGNCTKLSDGTWSGGGWSNAVYNANYPSSNYYLILQDDGNMCIYRGTGPNDNQGLIWCSNTAGKQQNANSSMVSSKGKYGKNWIATGATLAIGEFVGSNKGDLALVMTATGDLVLYTYRNVVNCQKMKDGNMGGGVGANAAYDIGKVAIPDNMKKLAFVDPDSNLHVYPSEKENNIKEGFRVEGFVQPKNPPIGVPLTTKNVDTIKYSNYIDGGAFKKEYGLSNATSVQRQQLDQLQTQMNMLSSQITNFSNKFGMGSNSAQLQSAKNNNGLTQYLSELNKTDASISNFNLHNNTENILQDSDIVVLQKNYDYLFWSILAAATIILTMNVVRK